MKKFLQNTFFTLMVLGSAIGLAYLASLKPQFIDITQNGSNTLEAETIKVLQQLSGPVSITVFASKQDAELGELHKMVREFIGLYQRHKPDLQLSFVDPVKEPDRAVEANIQVNGELIVEYRGRRERLTQLNEQVLSSALLRLARNQQQQIWYLDGHGERKLDGIANHDLGTPFGAKLKQNGFTIAPLNLAIAQEVPNNTSLLVITQPKLELLPGELDKLQRYLQRGGNLLWLVDPGPLYGLERLAETLSLQLPQGMIIDPAAPEMNVPASWTLAASYPGEHPIINSFDLISVFPKARPLLWNEKSDWQISPLVEIDQRGWISKADNVDQQIAEFDASRDIPGPAVLAIAMQREVTAQQQRVVVVGTGAFLANSFAGNGGNIDLGLNMINWLSHEDQLINLQPHFVQDRDLNLSRSELIGMGGGLLLLLPLLLIGNGLRIWWRRRQA